jgi:hypothetical protein
MPLKWLLLRNKAFLAQYSTVLHSLTLVQAGVGKSDAANDTPTVGTPQHSSALQCGVFAKNLLQLCMVRQLSFFSLYLKKIRVTSGRRIHCRNHAQLSSERASSRVEQSKLPGQANSEPAQSRLQRGGPWRDQ